MKQGKLLISFAIFCLSFSLISCKQLKNVKETFFYSTKAIDDNGNKFHSYDKDEPTFSRANALIEDGTLSPDRGLGFFDAISIWQGDTISKKKQMYVTAYTNFKDFADAYLNEGCRITFSSYYSDSNTSRDIIYLSFSKSLNPKYSFEKKSGLYPVARFKIPDKSKFDSLTLNFKYDFEKGIRSFGIYSLESSFFFEKQKSNEKEIETPLGFLDCKFSCKSAEEVDNEWFFTSFYHLSTDDRKFKKGKLPACGDACLRRKGIISLWHDLDMANSDEIRLMITKTTEAIESKIIVHPAGSGVLEERDFDVDEWNKSTHNLYVLSFEDTPTSHVIHLKDLFENDYSSQMSIESITSFRYFDVLYGEMVITERMRFYFDLSFVDNVPSLRNFWMADLTNKG